MSLENRRDLGTVSDMEIIPAKGIWVGMTEPDGGEVGISLDYATGKHLGVKCDSKRAREVAQSILELADIVEKWENERA